MKYAPLNPVVDDVGIDTQLLGNLLDGLFLGTLEFGTGNPVAIADPGDHRDRERFSLGAEVAFLVKRCGDLFVALRLCQTPHAFDGLLRVLYAILDLPGELYGESLASPETILAYPPLMSHKSLPRDVRESLGITDGFFRLSVGFEDVRDILGGFGQALDVL